MPRTSAVRDDANSWTNIAVREYASDPAQRSAFKCGPITILKRAAPIKAFVRLMERTGKRALLPFKPVMRQGTGVVSTSKVNSLKVNETLPGSSDSNSPVQSVGDMSVAPQLHIQQRLEFEKVKKFGLERSRDCIVKLITELNKLYSEEFEKFKTQERATFKNDDEHFRGVNLKKLGKLATLFPSTSLSELAICLLNNSELVPESLALLCKVFPNEDPQDLSDLTKEIVFNIGALKEAKKQGVRFQGAGIKRENVLAHDVASALKQFEGGDLKSLFELGQKYPDHNIINAVRLKQLKDLYPDCDPEKVLTELQGLKNASAFEFVELAKDETIPSAGSADNAIEQYQRYIRLMPKIREMFDGSEPQFYAGAWKRFREVSNASVEQFERLIRNGTVYRGEGEGNPQYAMGEYLEYLARFPHKDHDNPHYKLLMAKLNEFFPGTEWKEKDRVWERFSAKSSANVENLEKLRNLQPRSDLNCLVDVAIRADLTPNVLDTMKRLRKLDKHTNLPQLFKIAIRADLTPNVLNTMKRLRKLDKHTTLLQLFKIATNVNLTDKLIDTIEWLGHLNKSAYLPELFKIATSDDLTPAVKETINQVDEVKLNSILYDDFVAIAMKLAKTTDAIDNVQRLRTLKPNSNRSNLVAVATHDDMTKEIILRMERLDKRHPDASLDELFDLASKRADKKIWRFRFGFNIGQSFLRGLSSLMGRG